ncbi:hypothetical protein CDV36_003296 [Fusarium kuroshium]|uniref:C2H2-type domain-containing protein n=1 Tax=Fusarium kuroshium TaxID=2010991 RepID=A0A3M2SHK8_9HYPO|nr:hypothetical protein CDV36_003296 [Fusarium kuroshium]
MKTSESSKHRLVSESISNLLESYQEVVKSLFGHDHYPGLSGEEMELFRAHFGTAALTCRLGSCPRATLGFETERLRSEHERSHIRYFPCTFPGCQYPPLQSAQALRNHRSMYHAPTTARTAIRKDGTERHRHSREQSTVATSTMAPGYSPHRQVAQRTKMSGRNPQPQPQQPNFQSLSRKAPEGDADIQQQSTASAPPFTENRQTSEFEEITAPTSQSYPQIDYSTYPSAPSGKELSRFTHSPHMKHADIQMPGSANGTQRDDRSLPTKTLQHPVETISEGQNDSPLRLPDGSPAEPAHFRSMDTLDFVELGEQGVIFEWYSRGATMENKYKLLAAAAFGRYEEVIRLIFEEKVNPDPDIGSAGYWTKEEFSTPILAAIALYGASVVNHTPQLPFNEEGFIGEKRVAYCGLFLWAAMRT